jgi:hypothetical protein
LNYAKGGHESPRSHRFYLNSDEVSPLIVLPASNFSGSLPDLVAFEETRVNLRRLGDLAEEIVASLRQSHDRRELLIALRGGLDELMSRYFFRIMGRSL